MENELRLYLIPVDLGYSPEGGIYSPDQLRILYQIRHFVAENASTARKLLKKYGYPHPLQEIEIIEFNEHTRSFPETLTGVKALLLGHETTGLMSEAGMPCVADPGHEVVWLAHELKIRVIPFHGPSSIMQALIASGLQGQQFVFHGYLPAKTDARKTRLKQIQLLAGKDRYTHVFMEVPYRSSQMLRDITDSFSENFNLCVAAEIGTPEESINTKKIRQWKKALPDMHKMRCIFCVSA